MTHNYNIKYLNVFFIGLLIFTTINVNSISKIYSDDEYDYDYNIINPENPKCLPVYDPLESINRKIFIINSLADLVILKPIAMMYDRFTNDYIKTRVNSFTSNIKEPLSTVNYALQGQVKNSFKSFWRFVINTTVGVGGTFDVADRHFNLKPEQKDLASTLAFYGVGPGIHIVVPLKGSTSFRDLIGSLPFLGMNAKLNPARYYLPTGAKHANLGASMISGRAKILPLTKHIAKNSPDPYISIRDAIMQQQEAAVIYPKSYICPKPHRK